MNLLFVLVPPTGWYFETGGGTTVITHSISMFDVIYSSILPSPVASQKAKYVTQAVNRLAREKPPTPKPFQFKNQGSLAYLGDWYVKAILPSRSQSLSP